MAWRYGRTGGVRSALAKTFDGKHPCRLCVKIKGGAPSLQSALSQPVPEESAAPRSFVALEARSSPVRPVPSEFYLNGAYGFHSNDARGALTRIDPANGAAVDPVAPLVRTKGAEAGVRTLVVPGLQSTFSAWILEIGSELVFEGDAGATAPNRPSRRHGFEWANYYAPVKWLSFDADASLSRAKFRDFDPAGSAVPDSIQSVVAAGVSASWGRYTAAVRERYFGPRPLIEDESVRSKASSILSARLGAGLPGGWEAALDVFNLLDERANDIEYYYDSQLSGEAASVKDVHVHPAEPREFRVTLTKRF